MKFTLKDYQADAVRDVLNNLDDARDMYHRRKRTSSFSLSATTGAGKTVMAAAVIEALFEGNDEYNIEADPGAVILWFTDDPSLNEQTRFRLMEASDLAHSRLKVIQPNFHAEKLEPGNVYFLNAQKLSKNSLLVRGATDDGEGFPGMAAPDLRAATMWDILRNTIEDERLTLYLVLDEAHKGMKAPTPSARNEKQTIVKRLINGEGSSPAIPIVWGISATVKRFEEAMADAAGRTNLPSVAVDPIRVQESGLLKDDIRLEFPSETGQFDTTLLARAVKRTREASVQWEEYAKGQDPPIDPVVPLLVVQMPNKPDDELLLDAFRTVRENWPELSSESMAHVFGDHATIELGGFEVPHVAPEKVQDQTWIRVLFAKDAISTGWDCPRAEVLMSFRPAKEETHITQLLGRMVRTPLARRIPGNDRLNSVECLLPHFSQATAMDVARRILGSGDDDFPVVPGPRPLLEPVELRPNPEIPEEVWAAFDAMPSQTLPRKAAKPVKRLLALAHALSQDGLRERARRDAYAVLCSALDGLAVRFAEQLHAQMKDVGEMSGEAMVVKRSGEVQHTDFNMAADIRAIDADFQAAGRALTRELALKYAEHLVGDDNDDAFLDAHIKVASLARIPEVLSRLDVEAATLADAWFAEQRVAIKGLSHERQAIYDEIRAMAIEPYRIDVMRPDIRLEASLDTSGAKVPTAARHLMADENGNTPIGELNEWERKVLEKESARASFLGWYRNPARASSDSLAIAYQDGDHIWRRLCPDFVFFHGTPDAVQTSIVDPHGAHLGDAMPKLRGLAAYVEEYGDQFHRIEATAEVDGVMKVLDLKDAHVRVAVMAADDAVALYRSAVSQPY